MIANGATHNGYHGVTLEPQTTQLPKLNPVEVSKRIDDSYDNAWPIAKEQDFAAAIASHQSPIAYGFPRALQMLRTELRGHTDGSLSGIEELSYKDLSRLNRGLSTAALGILPLHETGAVSNDIAASPANALSFLESAVKARQQGNRKEFLAYYKDVVNELDAIEPLREKSTFFDTQNQAQEYDATIRSGIQHFKLLKEAAPNVSLHPRSIKRPNSLFLPFTVLTAAAAYQHSALTPAVPHAAKMAKDIASANFTFLPKN